MAQLVLARCISELGSSIHMELNSVCISVKLALAHMVELVSACFISEICVSVHDGVGLSSGGFRGGALGAQAPPLHCVKKNFRLKFLELCSFCLLLRK